LFAHWRWWWGRFERKVAYLHITAAVGSPFDSLHITIAVGGHSESKVAYLYIKVAAEGPLGKQGTYTLQLLLVAPMKAR